MRCKLSEEELWSGLDRNDPQIEEHIAKCAKCRNRAAEIRASMSFFSSAEEGATERPLPDRIGAYTIAGLLGEGGMGIVYEGEQQSLRRPVALKVIRGGKYVDDLRVRLFQREAQTLGRLQHPGIASIHEAGRTNDGQYFFVMELVEGLPLTDYAEQKQLNIEAKLGMFGKICEPVIYAHQRGVIHRDLKPSNILIDVNGNPKILDFGLARITDTDVTLTSTVNEAGRLMGTLPYMSPEEAKGNPLEIDVRSDVYSLGVVLFEMLTGELPYAVSRSALHEAVRTICEESPCKPSSLDKSIKGDLDTIVLKALEKDPERRYQSVQDLHDDLECHLADQPIRARPPSLYYHLQKLIVRQRIAFAVVFFLIAVVGGARWWILSGERKMQEAALALQSVRSLENGIQLRTLAELYHQHGDFQKADAAYRATIAAFQDARRGESRYAAQTKLGLGRLLVELADPSSAEEASILLGSAHAWYKRPGMAGFRQQVETINGYQALNHAQMHLASGNYRDARIRLKEALDIFESSVGLNHHYAAQVMLVTAMLLIEEDKPEESAAALAWLDKAQEIFESNGDVLGHASNLELVDALRNLQQARHTERQGHTRRSLPLYREAVRQFTDLLSMDYGGDESSDDEEVRGETPSYRMAAFCMTVAADALIRSGELRGEDEAKALLQTAWTLFDGDFAMDHPISARIDRALNALD